MVGVHLFILPFKETNQYIWEATEESQKYLQPYGKFQGHRIATWMLYVCCIGEGWDVGIVSV